MPKGGGETERKGPRFVARKGFGGVIEMVMRCNVEVSCKGVRVQMGNKASGIRNTVRDKFESGVTILRSFVRRSDKARLTVHCGMTS